MPDINLGYRLINNLLSKEGKAVLGKKEFLETIGHFDKATSQVIEKTVEGIENPIFELTGKATTNYNIASLKIKKGEQVIGSGAFSLSRKNILDMPDIKVRFDLPYRMTIRSRNVKVYEHKKPFIEEDINILPMQDPSKAANGFFTDFSRIGQRLASLYRDYDTAWATKFLKDKNGIIHII